MAASMGLAAAASMGLAALTAASAQVSITLPFTPVPQTLQVPVVLTGAAVLGPGIGVTSQIAYLLAGMAGLPVFAASAVLPPGPFRLLGPTGGYLLGLPLAAWIAGSLAQRRRDLRYIPTVLAMLAGLAGVFIPGIVWLAYIRTPFNPAGGLGSAVAAGLLPFIVTDVIEIVIAARVACLAGRVLRPDGSAVGGS